MIGNPYYRMLGLMGGNGTQLALATLVSCREERFQLEGKQVPVAGRAVGLTISENDEGGLFLCVGDSTGWFVLCRLEER